MRILFILPLLLVMAEAQAQEAAKAYLLEEDFAAGVASTLQDVTIKTVELSHAPGEFVYHLSSADKKTYKQLLNQCWAVERNDSLFLNSNKVFKTKDFDKQVYALVLFRSSNYLQFRAGRTKTFGIPPPFPYDDTRPGVVNAVAATRVADENRFHYLYDVKAKRVVYFNRGLMRSYAKQLPPEENALINYITKLIAAEE